MRRLATQHVPAPEAPEAPPATDRCPRCDERFGCGMATGRCWCAEVPLTADARARLAVSYDGCLCPTCLRELARDA